MFWERCVPWDHYPKTLKFSEVQNPLLVIKEFFCAGSLESHGRDLKKWRDHVIDDGFFNDARNGPGTLVFIHQLNLKLLEAAYLLYLSRREMLREQGMADRDQLAEEKLSWQQYPDNLKIKELINPYLALRTVFKNFKPQTYRDYLNEWLQAALSTQSIDENMTPGEVITVYERLLKLYAATWLINQREAKKNQQVMTPQTPVSIDHGHDRDV